MGNTIFSLYATRRCVVSSCFLLYVQAFWFAVPHAGAFTISIVDGRSEVKAVLRRARREEVLESQLVGKKMRNSVRCRLLIHRPPTLCASPNSPILVSLSANNRLAGFGGQIPCDRFGGSGGGSAAGNRGGASDPASKSGLSCARKRGAHRTPTGLRWCG